MKTEFLQPFGKLLIADAGADLSQFPFSSLEEMLRSHHLLVIRGLSRPSRDELLAYCEGAQGYRTLNWSFGPVMEMREVPDAPNYLFSREAVPFHWDGAFHQVPDYLVFSCVDCPTEGAGGETLFTSTETIFEGATTQEKKTWEQIRLTYETKKLAHYGGSIEGPLVQKHPHSGKTILRFAEAVETDLNPVTLAASGPEETSAALQDLARKIYDPRYCYSHAWQPGDLLIADNHSLIHGRTAFRKDEPRHLRRIQLIREKQ